MTRSLASTLGHDVRGLEDRGAALDEVMDYVKSRDAEYRRVATNLVVLELGTGVAERALEDAETEAFWATVRTASEKILT